MAEKSKKRMLMLTDGNVDNASARIRAIQYIPYFEARGFDVCHIPRVPVRTAGFFGKYVLFPVVKRFYSLRMVAAILLHKWDVAYIQRILINKFLIKILAKRQAGIIFDFDDAIYINPGRPENELKTARMVQQASQVIVSTGFLKDYCLNLGKDAVVIPSPVETTRIYPAQKKNNPVLTIGWIGSPWTTGFLELIEKPLQKLSVKYDFRFLTIGARHGYRIKGVNFVSRDWVFDEENSDLAAIDIGIMPLPDNDWTRMKGGYKLLQYFSAGIPCVASPVGINISIVKPGENGYLAATDEEWFAWLELLITHAGLREQLGTNGRKDAVELYSREVCFEKLHKAISI